MSAWFRAYAETLNDPKVQTLHPLSFKAWHNCLYLAASMNSNNGNIGTLESVSFAFRETQEAVSSAFHPLIERGLLVTDNETFHIVSWGKRQYKSDTSTNRVKRFRKRFRNVTETAPDTDTDTDTDTDISLLDKSNKGAYAFCGDVVKLKKTDYDRWKLSYPKLDLRAVLQSRDDWLTTQDNAAKKKWFQSTSSWLAKKQSDVTAAIINEPEIPL